MPNPIKTATGCRPGSLFGFWFHLSDRLDRYLTIVQGLDTNALAREHADLCQRAEWAADGLPLILAPNPTSAQGGRTTDGAKPYAMTRDGIALIRIAGPTTKYTTSFTDAIGGTATVVAQRLVRLAGDDPDVRGVMVHFDDAPGGTVAGAFELAADLRRVGKAKPVWSHGDDLCCSAAVLFATATGGRFTANAAGHVGSIGVLSQLVDLSGKYEKEGVRVIPIKSGRFKGAGMPGVAVSQEIIDDTQRKIDALNEMFVGSVAAGRSNLTPEKIKGWEARVFLADEAKAEGLIDDACSFEEAIGRFGAYLDKQRPAGNRGAAGTGRPAANGKTNMDLAQLCLALGVASTMSEADVLAHVKQMRTDLDAANARLATVPKSPDPDALADRAAAVADRIDARCEAGSLAVPVADAIKSAMGVPADGKGEAKPQAALLTPVAALGNKTVAAWAVDLFKLADGAGTTTAGEQVEGEQTPVAPTGKVLPRKTPGGDPKAHDEKLTPEREAELLGMSAVGREALDVRQNGNGRN